MVNVNAIINFAQTVKKATCLTNVTQYYSNNSLTPEFKSDSFEKRNNLGELINIPTKAEERSRIQISFKAGLNLKLWKKFKVLFFTEIES